MFVSQKPDPVPIQYLATVNTSQKTEVLGDKKRGLSALLVAQFMGAANDNVLKALLGFAVVSGGMWDGKLGQGGQGLIALCLFVPFILFSGWAGPFADRYSKRTISVLMKCLEIPLAITAGVGFATNNFWLAGSAMFLLATQSTFFSPAKYGMIPEIVPKKNIARANGILNMTTNIAIIAGMLVAGILSDHLKLSTGALHFWMPGIVLTGVAVIGLASIIWLPKLSPMDSNTTLTLNPLATYINMAREMRKSILMQVAIAWAFFYLLATIVLLLVNELGPLLQVSDTMVSYLLASIGVSVGIGSLCAGFISRGKIRVSLSKYASIGMASSVLFIGIFPVSYYNTLFGLIMLGFSAGLYAIPLQTLMQTLPSPGKRGQVLATSNAISFLLMATGSLLYWVLRPLFGNTPQYIFILCAGVSLIAWFVTMTIRVPSESNDTINNS